MYYIYSNQKRIPTRMFNENIIVAALAKRKSGTQSTDISHAWWNTFVGTNTPPSGMDSHGHPSFVPYNDHNTLGPGDGVFIGSSAIQIPWFATNALQHNPFYQEVFQSWLLGE